MLLCLIYEYGILVYRVNVQFYTHESMTKRPQVSFKDHLRSYATEPGRDVSLTRKQSERRLPCRDTRV